jgi:hypothetical protein
MRNHTVSAHGQYFRVNAGKPYVVDIPPDEQAAAAVRVKISQARSRDRPRLRETLLGHGSGTRRPADQRQAERQSAEWAEGTSSSFRRIVAEEAKPGPSVSVRPAGMSSGPGTDESDLDLGLPPDIFLSPFHRSPSDVSSGQDVDARVSALSVPQYYLRNRTM